MKSYNFWQPPCHHKGVKLSREPIQRRASWRAGKIPSGDDLI